MAGTAIVLLFLGNCKKPEDIGVSTLPDEDLVYTDYSDTATVETFTIKEDSLRADELSRALFGSIKDPDIGFTDVSFFGQVLLSSTPNLITDSSVARGIDSLVLALDYSGYYGDTSNNPVNIHVYRLTEDMHIDSSYYSNRSFQVDPQDLALNNPYEIRPNTPVVVGTDSNQVSQLRIRLSNELADSIFDKNREETFASNDNWKSWFKGIQIKIDQAVDTGVIVYFNASSESTKLTLYYHEGTTSKSYSFTMSGAASLTNTVHDFTGFTVEQQLLAPTVPFETNYLKSLAGLKTVLSFPYLKHFVDSGSILVNKAELVINIVSDTGVAIPTNILWLAKNSSGDYEFPIDYYERSYGGTINLSTRTYTFNVSRTVQQLLDGKDFDYGFSLNILGSMISGNSVAIGGGKPGGPSQMKLKLYYTKLQK